ncbi:LOW QUALITY PROTEIN: constitutive coactivator of PPAR-gamma-like protein 1 [Pholidichthys leucotaenia]
MQGEIKLLVTTEDEANKALPSVVQLFRPIRYVYGVLFSLAEARKKAERLAVRRTAFLRASATITELLYAAHHLLDTHVMVKEWVTYKGKSPHSPELMAALPLREWTCPNLEKLYSCRTTSNVPTPLLMLCCVLWFMLRWPGARILHRNELDAFLPQALSPKLYEPDQLQQLKIDNLYLWGIQLAALFMSGVDMALFASDTCREPVPWEHCCSWMYFDGKLLQSKLIMANREKAQLINLCDAQQIKPAHTSGHDVTNERKKQNSLLAMENSIADKQLNRVKEEQSSLFQPESAFSSDSKMCNTNLHLHALNVGTNCLRHEGLQAAALAKD